MNRIEREADQRTKAIQRRFERERANEMKAARTRAVAAGMMKGTDQMKTVGTALMAVPQLMPDAVSGAVTGQVTGCAGPGVEVGNITMLNGADPGQTVEYEEYKGGGGTEASGGVTVGAYWTFGDQIDFSSNSFAGEAGFIQGSIGPVSLGVTLFSTASGDAVVGLQVGLGFGGGISAGASETGIVVDP